MPLQWALISFFAISWRLPLLPTPVGVNTLHLFYFFVLYFFLNSVFMSTTSWLCFIGFCSIYKEVTLSLRNRFWSRLVYMKIFFTRFIFLYVFWCFSIVQYCINVSHVLTRFKNNNRGENSIRFDKLLYYSSAGHLRVIDVTLFPKLDWQQLSHTLTYWLSFIIVSFAFRFHS